MNEPKTQAESTSPAKRSKKHLVGGIVVGLLSFALGSAITYVAYPKIHPFGTIYKDNSATSLVGSSDYSDIEACDILRQKDVETVLGGTVYKEQAGMIDNDPDNPPTPTVCIYSADTDPKNGITRLNLDHFKGDIDRARIAYESQEYSALNAMGGVEVKDLGDDAFWTPKNASLTVHKGDTIFMLVLGDPNLEARTLERTTDLAKKALNRY